MGLRKWAQSNEFNWKKSDSSNQYNPFNPFKFNWIKSFGLSWVCPPYPTLLNPADELNKINVWALTAQQLYFFVNYWNFLSAQLLNFSFGPISEPNYWISLESSWWNWTKINVWALSAQLLNSEQTLWIHPNSYATAELNSTAELNQPYWIGLFQSKCRTKLFTSPASMTSSPLLLL